MSNNVKTTNKIISEKQVKLPIDYKNLKNKFEEQ